jgi:hypothetical protein
MEAGKPVLWHKINRLHILCMDIGTEAMVQGEDVLTAWTDRVSAEALVFLRHTRRLHYGTEAKTEADTVVT